MRTEGKTTSPLASRLPLNSSFTYFYFLFTPIYCYTYTINSIISEMNTHGSSIRKAEIKATLERLDIYFW